MKLLTRLCQRFSHLHEQNRSHWFHDTLDPLCEHCINTEITTRFFPHCPTFHTPWQTLLSNIRNIDEQILSPDKFQLIRSFYMAILTTACALTIEYLISTEKFKCPIFHLIFFPFFVSNIILYSFFIFWIYLISVSFLVVSFFLHFAQVFFLIFAPAS